MTEEGEFKPRYSIFDQIDSWQARRWGELERRSRADVLSYDLSNRPPCDDCVRDSEEKDRTNRRNYVALVVTCGIVGFFMFQPLGLLAGIIAFFSFVLAASSIVVAILLYSTGSTTRSQIVATHVSDEELQSILARRRAEAEGHTWKD
jgi:hypothetical protein